MRKSLVAVVVCLFAVGAFAQQPQPQWVIQGDHNETVHVLPAAASVRADHDPQPAIAGPSNGVTYAAASYGSVPGHLDNHGGKVMAGAVAFQAVFYNAQVAGSLQSTIEGFVSTFGNSADYTFTLAQYPGSNGSISGTLTRLTSLVDAQPAPRRISDTGVQSYLTGLFNAGKLTASNTVLYGVYRPHAQAVDTGEVR